LNRRAQGQGSGGGVAAVPDPRAAAVVAAALEVVAAEGAGVMEVAEALGAAAGARVRTNSGRRWPGGGRAVRGRTGTRAMRRQSSELLWLQLSDQARRAGARGGGIRARTAGHNTDACGRHIAHRM
jgi:hypothetical protein